MIALGAVIRGGTAHFEFVAGEAAKGIASVQNSTGIPVAFGVLTVDTIEQAIERSGTKAGNKGLKPPCAHWKWCRCLNPVIPGARRPHRFPLSEVA